MTETRVTPANCALAVGIPLCREQFASMAHSPPARDFVPRQLAAHGERARRVDSNAYDQRYALEVPRYQASIAAAQQGGAHVETCATLDTLSRLAQNFSVVTVVAHSPPPLHSPTLELFDGIHSGDDVAAALPNDWHGVLELLACRSEPVGEIVKRQHPRCLVIHTPGVVTPLVQLLLYQHAIMALERMGPAHYTTVVLDLIARLIDLTQPSS